MAFDHTKCKCIQDSSHLAIASVHVMHVFFVKRKSLWPNDIVCCNTRPKWFALIFIIIYNIMKEGIFSKYIYKIVAIYYNSMLVELK